MANDFIPPPPSPTLRQPIWLAILISVGLHGAIALGWPLFAALSKTPESWQEQSVNLVELTPAEQKRLPNLSASPFKIPSLSGQPFNLLPSLPPPPESSSLQMPKLPSVDNSSSLYNIPPLPYSSSLPDLSNLPALPPLPEYSAPSQLPSVPTEETRLPTLPQQENFSGIEPPPAGNWPAVQTPLLRSDWGSLPSSPVTPPLRQSTNTLPGGVLPGLSIEDPLPPPDRPDEIGSIASASGLPKPLNNGADSLKKPSIIPPSSNKPSSTPPGNQPPIIPPSANKPPSVPPTGNQPKNSQGLKKTLVSIRLFPETTPPPVTQPQNAQPPQPKVNSVKEECSNLANPNRTRLETARCQNIASANNSGGSNSERSPSTTTTSVPQNPPISPDGPISPDTAIVEKAVLAYNSWVESLKPTYPNLETTKPQTIPASYPKEADSQQQAATLVGVLVSSQGEILSAKPLMSTGNDALNQAAVEAAKNQKFSSSESGKIKAYQFVVEFKSENQLKNTDPTEQPPTAPANEPPQAKEPIPPVPANEPPEASKESTESTPTAPANEPPQAKEPIPTAPANEPPEASKESTESTPTAPANEPTEASKESPPKADVR